MDYILEKYRMVMKAGINRKVMSKQLANTIWQKMMNDPLLNFYIHIPDEWEDEFIGFALSQDDETFDISIEQMNNYESNCKHVICVLTKSFGNIDVYIMKAKVRDTDDGINHHERWRYKFIIDVSRYLKQRLNETYEIEF